VTAGWKDWVTGCSLALAAGVLVGTVHAHPGSPAARQPAPAGPAQATFPPPEDNLRMVRGATGAADGRHLLPGGSAAAGTPGPAAKPVTASRVTERRPAKEPKQPKEPKEPKADTGRHDSPAPPHGTH
jgi:hypothetical protein